MIICLSVCLSVYCLGLFFDFATMCCLSWFHWVYLRYEIHVGGVLRVLSDPMASREQKEYFRHVLARHKILLAATGATKMLRKMATGEYVRK